MPVPDHFRLPPQPNHSQSTKYIIAGARSNEHLGATYQGDQDKFDNDPMRAENARC